MAAPRGKRVAPKQTGRRAPSAPSPLAGSDAPAGQYRFQQRPQIAEIKPKTTMPLGRPMAVAGVALAGILGAGALQGMSSSYADAKIADDAADRAPVPSQREIVVASSTADEAVMHAAEVLNTASAASASDDPKVQAATEHLRNLLDDIEQEALLASGRTQDAASRSAERVSLASSPVISDDSPAPSSTASPSSGVAQGRGAADAAQPSIASASKNKVAQGEAAHHDAASATATVEAEQPVQSVTTEPQVTEPGSAISESGESDVLEAATASDSELSELQASIVVDDKHVAVTLTDDELDLVLSATERLEELMVATSSMSVTSATELKEQALLDAWTQAVDAVADMPTYANGRIPRSALKAVDSAPGQYLRSDAAIMFEQMNAAFKEQFGHDIGMTDSYRSYSLQVSTKAAKGWLAARPGTSNHGWGLAVDLSGKAAQWGTAERNWIVSHGKEYGWVSPNWAQSSKPEPWHFEFVGAKVSPVGSEISGALDVQVARGTFN